MSTDHVNDPDGAAAGKEVSNATWTGAEEYSRNPEPGQSGSYELRELNARRRAQERHAHEMQKLVTTGVVVTILASLTLIILGVGFFNLPVSFAEEILRTVLGPLVVGGLIAIVSFLFRSNSE